jgi:hypothetical protein
MSKSRVIGAIAAIGGTFGAIAPQVTGLNPKLGAIMAIVGLGITLFTERLHGGLSKPRKAAKALDEAKK